jgi:hypothetical protein
VRDCVSHGDKAVADGVDVACDRSALEGFRADFKSVYMQATAPAAATARSRWR